MRLVSRQYRDPLDQVWLGAAAAMGVKVSRSSEVFAAWDGAGGLVLGAPDTLDADDCLGQMIFHELCHSLVQGPANLSKPDWGLDNIGDGDLPRERACLRTQCALLTPLGLRRAFAPTTEHRAFYDSLPADALHGEGDVVLLARAAVDRTSDAPWNPHLHAALKATRAIIGAASDFASETDLLKLDCDHASTP
ncbi:MAG: hypothetical protein AB8H86_31005 [Polyangiales bacterium]